MKTKARTILLGAVAALWIGGGVRAETINYDLSGWQTTCSATFYTGIEGDCIYNGKSQGTLSNGTIAGTAQFVGDSSSGGTLEFTSQIYVTSPTPGVGPATIVTYAWVGLAQLGDPAGLTATTGGGGVINCTPTNDVICNTPNTPLPVTTIDIYGPGATVGGTFGYLVTALASGGVNLSWQNFVFTVKSVPEPGTALLWVAAATALAVSGWMRKQ